MSNLLVALFAIAVQSSVALCPNHCSYHGNCDEYNRCNCWSNWAGADCSERKCPVGTAWQGIAISDDVAHIETECSSRGTCVKATGLCVCEPGFEGSACERMSCSSASRCTGHGQCQTLSEYARAHRSERSESYEYDVPWDSNSIVGCRCDREYTGYDCSLRQCPTGDDPLTLGQVNEVQLIVCQATGGSFHLVYEDEMSAEIPYDATVDEVREAILSIPSVRDVYVEFAAEPTLPACVDSSLNLQVIKVEFTQNFGPLRPMWSYASALNPIPTNVDPPITIIADGTSVVDFNSVAHFSVKGTKENAPCSSRGSCNTATGVCSCYESASYFYAGSDGYGGKGDRGDCGHEAVPTTACPGNPTCSGHGQCDTLTFTCKCSDGWTSGDCSKRTCPQGRSWFSYPSADNEAHTAYSECSDAGVCDSATGLCRCHMLFEGSACEKMKCPGSGFDECSGHGQCLSMSQLARSSSTNGVSYRYGTDLNDPSTWDADSVHGCLCDEGFTAAATASDVKQYLEELDAITYVDVRFRNGISDAVCLSPTDQITEIEFITEHGNVPSIQVDGTLLIDDNNGGAVGSGTAAVATNGAGYGGYVSVTGTTEDIECSGRGICDRETGLCSCFDGWRSSDGRGNVGEVGDCGYRVPYSGLQDFL